MCHGGSIEASEEVLLELPPGVRDGLLPCRSLDGRLVRDLRCLIRVRGHERFERVGDDLHMARALFQSSELFQVLVLSLSDALLGGVRWEKRRERVASRLRHLDGREITLPRKVGRHAARGTVARC